MQCQREDVFHCNGRPSLCYRHDGDGDCEDFERKTSIKDCGFYTPDGFKDQWVHSAKANPKYILHNEYCPADVVIGEPRPDLVGMAMRVSIYSRILTLHCTRTPEPHQITPEHQHITKYHQHHTKSHQNTRTTPNHTRTPAPHQIKSHQHHTKSHQNARTTPNHTRTTPNHTRTPAPHQITPEHQHHTKSHLPTRKVC